MFFLEDTYVKAGRRKPREEREKKEIHYTYDEAVDKILEMANKRAGVFPLEEDYIEAEDAGAIDIDGLVEALKIKSSMMRNNVKAYAAINIETLRALRKREGRKVRIVTGIRRQF